MNSSKIFTGHRALGFVSNHIPLCIRYIKRRQEELIITVVDRCFHTYGSNHLKLLSVSPAHPDEISCVACDKYLVFTGCQNVIYAWRRGTELQRTYEGHEKSVHLLMPFGPHLISVDAGNDLKVWDIKSKENVLDMTFDIKAFKITTLMHPSTYLNKILLGSEQGALQLWNIRTSKLVYTYIGWKCAITYLDQAPALDVAAIGLSSGDIYLHNLKVDETLVKFTQDWGPVLQLSFRTDDHPYLASSSPSGHIAIWNLEKRKLEHQMRKSHRGAVTGLRFLPNEPLMVTSSPDNSLKMWIFDQSDGSGRLLRLREGHSAPPIKIRFHGSSGVHILSAGMDSTLRSFSTVGDNLNKNLGQASLNRKLAKKKGIQHDDFKLTPITDFTSETTREKEWDNIGACHRNFHKVTTWSYDNCRMGKHKLLHERFQGQSNIVALCITMSPCGNFVLIGYNTGHVDKYNIQSGIHRGCYGKEKAHNGAVRGVAVDGLSQLTITAGGDKRIVFWNFKQCHVLGELNLESPPSQIVLHRESGMLAAVLDDLSVIIVDQETRNIIRNFVDHQSRVTDLTFSPDSRWVITASMDNLVRTWDLPSGRLVDCFAVPTPCTSLTMSPCGDFLATTHANDIGVYLWCNMTLYTHVSLQPLPNDYLPSQIDLPVVSADVRTTGKESAVSEEEMAIDEMVEDYKSPEQISDELVTLSLLPHSHWKNLLNLDVIKQRNKPIQKNETPKLAPFFIPTIAGLQPTFNTEAGKEVHKKQTNLGKLFGISGFGQMLLDCGDSDNYDSILIKLKELGPSAINVELSALSPYATGSEILMSHFLKAISQGLTKNSDFELVQSYLGLFLKLHSDYLTGSKTLRVQLEEISAQQEKSWTVCENKLNQSLCLVNYFRSSVI